jgi:hypothetical protein
MINNTNVNIYRNQSTFLHTFTWMLACPVAVLEQQILLESAEGIHPLLVASLSMLTTTGTGIAPFATELAQNRLAGLPLITSHSFREFLPQAVFNPHVQDGCPT